MKRSNPRKPMRVGAKPGDRVPLDVLVQRFREGAVVGLFCNAAKLGWSSASQGSSRNSMYEETRWSEEAGPRVVIESH